MTEGNKFADRFQAALEDSMLRMLAAVEAGVVTVATAGQATGGAAAGVAGQVSGGSSETVAGSGSQQTHTGTSHKNDVSVPELAESSNLFMHNNMVSTNASMNSDLALASKINVRTFDIVSGALSFATLGSGANMYQQQTIQTTHADEEYSARKRATEISLVTVGDAVEEGADDTDRAK